MDVETEAPKSTRTRSPSRLGLFAAAAAGLMALAWSARLVDSPDVGYHLAYGEHFLETGRIVDTNRWIYTELDPAALAHPDSLGPGCRFDADAGTYRFVNANWLSQVLMALVARAGGMAALSWLQVLLMAGMLAPAVVSARRHGLPWAGVGLVVLAIGYSLGPRVPVRPEVFGYVVLSLQWCLAASPRFGRREAVLLAALQALAVNLHSYFPLGVALAGAAAAGAWLAALRPVRGSDAPAARQRAAWLSVATAGTILACLASPGFVRGAWMPVETLAYLRHHAIAGGEPPAGIPHPWVGIREFRPTFEHGWRPMLDSPVTVAYLGCLVAGGLAAVLSIRRRPGWSLAIAGLIAVSASMNRNMGLMVLLVAPVAAVALYEWARAARTWPQATGAAIALATAAIAIPGAFGIVTNRVHLEKQGHARFGWGASRIALPIDAAGWIDRHEPPGRVFCDFDQSSNLMYFTHPHREVPVLTNTWACPPGIMLHNILMQVGVQPFDDFADRHGVRTVVVQTAWKPPSPLFRSLMRSPEWAVVDLGANHAVLVRRADDTAALLAAAEIRPETFDVADYIRRAAAADPEPEYALDRGAELLARMGWYDAASTVWEESLRREPRNPAALTAMASTELERAADDIRAAQAGVPAALEGGEQAIRQRFAARLARAEEFAQRALAIDANLTPALAVMRQVEDGRRALGGGA